MKTRVELPIHLIRKAKATAAERGQPQWMKGFPALKRLHDDTARVQSTVDQEFETKDPEISALRRDEHFDAVSGIRRIGW